jgi:hypothetical protein
MKHGTDDVRGPYAWDDLSFTFLTGRDVEQIFDAPEYIILPSMMTSTAGPGPSLFAHSAGPCKKSGAGPLTVCS